MKQHQIYLNASDVAAVVGMNRFKTPYDVVQTYLKRSSVSRAVIEAEEYSATLDDSVEIVSKLGNDEQKKDVRVLADIITDCLEQQVIAKELPLPVNKEQEEKIEVLKKTIEDKKIKLGTLNKQVVETALQAAVVEADPKQSQEEQKKVVDALPSTFVNGERKVNTFVNTERGKQGEATILNRYEAENNTTVKDRNSRMFYINVGEFNIGGRIDGFDRPNRRLVEVKKRRNNFLGMPKYEKVQCEIYMRMLGLSECVHVEEYNENQKETIYCRNEKLWGEIDSGLENFYAHYEEELNQL